MSFGERNVSVLFLPIRFSLFLNAGGDWPLSLSFSEQCNLIQHGIY